MQRTVRGGLLAAVLLLSQPVLSAEDLKPVNRVSPEFPREANAAGVDRGHVKARITIDASGEVSRVEIVEANPRRIFDRAVVRTLSQWRYPPGTDGRTTDIDVDFVR